MLKLNHNHICFKSPADFPYPCDYLYHGDNGGSYEPYYLPEEYLAKLVLSTKAKEE